MLHLNPVNWFSHLSPEWATLLISMIPVTEIRASIPIGIEIYKLPVWEVWLLAVVGDMIPPLFILYLMPRLHDWLINRKMLGKVTERFLNKAERKFKQNYTKYGALALIIFVGIPLPMTGSWTGSLAAFVFNIPFRKSVPLIFAGVCLAATVITAITLGAGGIFHALF